MSILTFKGGIHPFEGKELSQDLPIVSFKPKGEVVYPLSQHIGAPATPIVEVGERVLVGQKIAEASGFVSANIHASVSGTVTKIEPRLTLTGVKQLSIIVECDDEFETFVPDVPEGGSLLENFTKKNIIYIMNSFNLSI